MTMTNMVPVRLDRKAFGVRYSQSVCFFFGAFSLYFLLSEHWAPFLDALPYVLLSLCPLMHILVHHGHRGHGDRHGNRRDEDEAALHQRDRAA